jgi:hypothetical protein
LHWPFNVQGEKIKETKISYARFALIAEEPGWVLFLTFKQDANSQNLDLISFLMSALPSLWNGICFV